MSRRSEAYLRGIPTKPYDPYTFVYQIPPMSASPNGDLQVGVIITVLFLVTVFAPFVPILNRLPRWLRVYRLIWRDWYRR